VAPANLIGREPGKQTEVGIRTIRAVVLSSGFLAEVDRDVLSSGFLAEVDRDVLSSGFLAVLMAVRRALATVTNPRQASATSFGPFGRSRCTP
jgi:hypothetical protein